MLAARRRDFDFGWSHGPERALIDDADMKRARFSTLPGLPSLDDKEPQYRAIHCELSVSCGRPNGLTALAMGVTNFVAERPQIFDYGGRPTQYPLKDLFRVPARRDLQLQRYLPIEGWQVIGVLVLHWAFVEDALANCFEKGACRCNRTFRVCVTARQCFLPNGMHTFNVEGSEDVAYYDVYR